MAPTTVSRSDALPPETRSQVLALVATAEATDGVRPLNEEGDFAVEGAAATHWTVQDGDEVVAYAQRSPVTDTAQLVVLPRRRREGIGRRLVAAVAEESPTTSWWAFGELPAAGTLAARLGYQVTRRLLVMGRPLDSTPPVTVRRPLRIDTYSPGDGPALVALNARAFADHPEQGRLTLADVERRMAEPWFEPAGLLLGRDPATGDLLGFHWTKRHDADVGEVYVLGVAPEAQGTGVGGALLAAGLAHLRTTGARRVILYVEESNAAAVSLYRSANFGVVHSDACYAPPRPQESWR